jgi:hypothetical protein
MIVFVVFFSQRSQIVTNCIDIDISSWIVDEH